MNREMLIERLGRFPMLAELPETERGAFLDILEEEDFPEGSRIIEEGSEGDCMYILLEGQVEILKTTLYGEEYVCAKLEDTESCVFGEIALIDQDVRSATVRALTKCHTLRMSQEKFHDYCEKNPMAGCKVLWFISANLCRNLRKENDNLLKVYAALVDEIEKNI
ncbi:MAG: cyclic nucleotide-binding domain-containing protein [Lachnospiraceae bacterium]|nr:cyclic nucleotide-binding domain-containing protein [Lachnospiraceae bacterium]